MRLSFHRLVQDEVNAAIAWYDQQRPGLGGEFFSVLTKAFDVVAERPDGFGFWLASESIRRVKLNRFPYAVLYEIKTDRVRVLCVRHDKRHPAYGFFRK